MADVSDYSEYDDSMMDDDDDGSDFYDSENPSPVVAKKKGGAAVRRASRCVCVGSRSPLERRDDCSTTVSFSDARDDDDADGK